MAALNFSDKGLDQATTGENCWIQQINDAVKNLNDLSVELKKSNELDLQNVQKDIQDLYTCGSKQIQGLLEALEQNYNTLVQYQDEKRKLIDEYEAEAAETQQNLSSSNNFVTVYETQLKNLKAQAKELHTGYEKFNNDKLKEIAKFNTDKDAAQKKFNEDFEKKKNDSIAAAKKEFEDNKKMSKDQIKASLDAKKDQLTKRKAEKDAEIKKLQQL